MEGKVAAVKAENKQRLAVGPLSHSPCGSFAAKQNQALTAAMSPEAGPIQESVTLFYGKRMSSCRHGAGPILGGAFLDPILRMVKEYWCWSSAQLSEESSGQLYL